MQELESPYPFLFKEWEWKQNIHSHSPPLCTKHSLINYKDQINKNERVYYNLLPNL